MWKDEAWKLYLEGVPQVQIAEQLGVATSTLNDEIKRRRLHSDAKILIYDIETSPGISFYWSRWDKFLPQVQVIQRPGCVLTWSAKWLGDEGVMNDSSINHGDPLDDFGVCESLWHLFDKADIVVAHNGDKFDVKKLQTRWAFHGLTPPSPYRAYDTLKAAKRKFGMDSNRLNDIGDYFDIGTKYKHEGFGMWRKCMSGSPTLMSLLLSTFGYDAEVFMKHLVREAKSAQDEGAFAEMIKYNDEDTLLLERVYEKLRNWDHLHPNLGVYDDNDGPVCSHCGSDDIQITSKSVHTNVSQFTALRCNSCGGWSRYRISTKSLEQKSQIVVSAK